MARRRRADPHVLDVPFEPQECRSRHQGESGLALPPKLVPHPRGHRVAVAARAWIHSASPDHASRWRRRRGPSAAEVVMEVHLIAGLCRVRLVWMGFPHIRLRPQGQPHVELADEPTEHLGTRRLVMPCHSLGVCDTCPTQPPKGRERIQQRRVQGRRRVVHDDPMHTVAIPPGVLHPPATTFGLVSLETTARSKTALCNVRVVSTHVLWSTPSRAGEGPWQPQMVPSVLRTRKPPATLRPSYKADFHGRENG